MNTNFNYDFLLYVKNLLLYYIIFLELFSMLFSIPFNIFQFILNDIKNYRNIDFYNIIIA